MKIKGVSKLSRIGIALAMGMGTLVAVGTAGMSQSSASPKKLVIGLDSEGLNAAFPAAIAKGFTTEGKKLHVRTIVLNSNLTESEQAANMQTLIADHVSGIVIDVVESGPSVALVHAANRAHIPVMLVHGYAGAKVPPPVIKGVAFDITENETTGGVDAGKLALKANPGGGDYAIIDGSAGYAAVQQRSSGFQSVVSKAGGWNLVAEQPGAWTEVGGATACTSILEAHPSLKLIFTESDDMAVGCVTSVKAAHSTAKIVSIGGEGIAKPDVQSGAIYGTVCYLPGTEGSQVIAAMVQLLRGQKKYNRVLDYYNTPQITKANINACLWQA